MLGPKNHNPNYQAKNSSSNNRIILLSSCLNYQVVSPPLLWGLRAKQLGSTVDESPGHRIASFWFSLTSSKSLTLSTWLRHPGIVWLFLFKNLPLQYVKYDSNEVQHGLRKFPVLTTSYFFQSSFFEILKHRAKSRELVCFENVVILQCAFFLS